MRKKNVKGKCYKFLTQVENKKALWISGPKNCDLHGNNEQAIVI